MNCIATQNTDLLFNVNKAVVYLCRSNPEVVSSFIESLDVYFKSIGLVMEFNYDQNTMCILIAANSDVANTVIISDIYNIGCEVLLAALYNNKTMVSEFINLDIQDVQYVRGAIMYTMSILDISVDNKKFMIRLHN